MKRAIVISLCTLAALTGCGRKNNPQTLSTHTWELSEVLTAAGSETPPLGITISFDDSLHIASGNGGCNQYSTTYNTGDQDTITFETPAATQMACLNIEFEGRYFGWLSSTQNYKLSPDELHLISANTTLVFKPEFK